jgi:hypothetical protein
MYTPADANTGFYSSALAAVMPGAVQPASTGDFTALPVDGPLLDDMNSPSVLGNVSTTDNNVTDAATAASASKSDAGSTNSEGLGETAGGLVGAMSPKGRSGPLATAPVA